MRYEFTDIERSTNVVDDGACQINERYNTCEPNSKDHQNATRDNLDQLGGGVNNAGEVAAAAAATRNDEIEEASELVIDGELVSLPTRQKRYCVESILFLITILLICVVVTVYQKHLTSSKPATSTFTPSELLYDDFIKQIAIPISGEDVLDDHTTVQHKMWKSMALAMPTMIENSVVHINDTEKLDLKYTMLVLAFSASSNFLEKGAILPKDEPRVIMDACLYVSCSHNRQVTGIVLRNEWFSRLGGGIIAREIGSLSNLNDLILTRNGLQGTIPTELCNLKDLKVLNLRNNSFTGTIPTEIGRLENLEVLLLDDNLLQGTIPSEIGRLSKLKYLGVSRNRLSGLVPTALDSLRNLTSVALHGNNVTWNVDYRCPGNLMNSSVVLELDVGLSSYPYEVDLGVTIDCNDTGEIIECSCCRCMETR